MAVVCTLMSYCVLQVVRSAVQRLFDRQRDNVLANVTAAASIAADAIAEIAAARLQQEGHERLAVNAMAALAKELEACRASASRQLAEQHAWAQERLLSSFCDSKDYRYRTC